MLVAQQDIRPLIEFTLAPLFEDHGIPLAVMGILVVFSVLILIATFIQLLPRFMPLLPPTAEQQPAVEPAVQPVVEDELSEEILECGRSGVARESSPPLPQR